MRIQLTGFVLAALTASAAAAQTQPATPPATQQTTTSTQQTPTETQTTTTDSTTTAVPGTPATPAQTQTTTTKSTTTTPTDATSATTGQSTTATEKTTSTTTTDATAPAPVTAADVKKGAAVYDAKGGRIGKVESVKGDNAVVSTGTARASIPISSFAKNDKGLVLATTKAEINAQAGTKKKTK